MINENIDSLNITFIGGGNMGQALIGGMLKSGWLAENINVIDTDTTACTALEKIYPQCNVYSQTEAVLNIADIVVLAVKPEAIKNACEQIAEQCQAKRPLIISVAAGVLTNSIDTWLGGEMPIVRCMPNTPALVQAGTTGLYANAEVSEEQREITQYILNCVGSTLWLDNESLLDAVTAISGSGPAYFFYMIEAMFEVGQILGLDEAQVRQLTIDTALGAAKLIEETSKSPSELRISVTSKGGTTEAAINTLNKGDVKNTIRTAIKNAAKKSQQLSCSDGLLEKETN